MPRACQPSKKAGSSSVQRRYFSTATSSSPSARSPFASSNSSVTSAFSLIVKSTGRVSAPFFPLTQTRETAPLLQPLLKSGLRQHALNPFHNPRFLLIEIGLIDRQAFVDVDEQTACLSRDEIAKLTDGKVAGTHHHVAGVGLIHLRLGLGKCREGLGRRARLLRGVGEGFPGLHRFLDFLAQLRGLEAERLIAALVNQVVSELLLCFLESHGCG